jgi:hypothetical protein
MKPTSLWHFRASRRFTAPSLYILALASVGKDFVYGLPWSPSNKNNRICQCIGLYIALDLPCSPLKSGLVLSHFTGVAMGLGLVK